MAIYEVMKLRFQGGEPDEIDGEIVEVLSKHDAAPGASGNSIWYITALVRIA